jgi:hypothetical protein
VALYSFKYKGTSFGSIETKKKQVNVDLVLKILMLGNARVNILVTIQKIYYLILDFKN